MITSNNVVIRFSRLLVGCGLGLSLLQEHANVIPPSSCTWTYLIHNKTEWRWWVGWSFPAIRARRYRQGKIERPRGLAVRGYMPSAWWWVSECTTDGVVTGFVSVVSVVLYCTDNSYQTLDEQFSLSCDISKKYLDPEWKLSWEKRHDSFLASVFRSIVSKHS